jgi:hypothetical protein
MVKEWRYWETETRTADKGEDIETLVGDIEKAMKTSVML